ncbi:MAG: HIT family protein [Pseudomonadales bacterium]|nr:HIT family protein [Candidatus Woesebacteria bacterium]MCB9802056.1 HIT family protein [Pseudomonadales bacterium]
MTDCLFCQIVAGQAPAHTIFESETHLAFLSIFPNTEGVSVVIPKAHHPSYVFENDPATIAALMTAAQQTAALLDATFDDVGRCGIVFEGFGVDHLHAKLYPLHGTGNQAEWQQIESTNNKAYYERYPGFISSNDSKLANSEELAQLAQRIRSHKTSEV